MQGRRFLSVDHLLGPNCSIRLCIVDEINHRAADNVAVQVNLGIDSASEEFGVVERSLARHGIRL